MHIALALFTWFPHGGAQRDALAVAEGLRDRGHRVTVLTHRWRGPRPAGIDVRELPIGGATNHGRNQSFAKAAAKAIAAGRPDFVLGFNRMPGLDAYFAADRCFAERAAQRGRLYRMTPRARAMMAMERAVFAPEARTAVLLLVERERQTIQRHYATPDRRFHLIPPIVPPANQRPADSEARSRRATTRAALQLDDASIALLFVASHFRTKGLDRALTALTSLPPALRERIHLFVVGSDDPLAYRRGKIAKRTHFLGACDNLPELMLASDLLIHPAREENAGKVLLESLAMGLPILCSGICGYAEHVARAGAGIVLPEPFRQEALDRALADMLAQLPQADWSRNAARYAQHTLGFGQGIGAVVDTVERLAAERRERP